MRHSVVVAIGALVLSLGCRAPSAGSGSGVVVAPIWVSAQDEIRVTAISGDRSRLEPGGHYVVEGTVRLGSRDQANLRLGCMSGDVGGENLQGVYRGEARFRFAFTYVKEGFPHLSLYPSEGGNSFGSAYFAQGEVVALTKN